MSLTSAAKYLTNSPLFKLTDTAGKHLGKIATPIATGAFIASPVVDLFNAYNSFKAGNTADGFYYTSKTFSDTSIFLAAATPLITLVPLAAPVTASIGLAGMLGYGIHKWWHGEDNIQSFTVTEWLLEAARFIAPYTTTGALIAGVSATGSFVYNWCNNRNPAKDGYITVTYTGIVVVVSTASLHSPKNKILENLKFWSIDIWTKLKDPWTLLKDFPGIAQDAFYTIPSLHVQLTSCINAQPSESTTQECIKLKKSITTVTTSAWLVKLLDNAWDFGKFLDNSVFSIYPGMLKPGIEAFASIGNDKKWIDVSTKTQGFVRLWSANANPNEETKTSKKIIDLMSKSDSLEPTDPENIDKDSTKKLKVITRALDLVEGFIDKTVIERVGEFIKYYTEAYAPYFSGTISSQNKDANPAKFLKDILTHPWKKMLPLELAFVITKAKLITDHKLQTFCNSNSPKAPEWNNVCERINKLIPLIKEVHSMPDDSIADYYPEHPSLPLPTIAWQFLNTTPLKQTTLKEESCPDDNFHCTIAEWRPNPSSTITGVHASEHIDN